MVTRGKMGGWSQSLVSNSKYVPNRPGEKQQGASRLGNIHMFRGVVALLTLLT